jgi:hypothetical protein
MKEFRSRRKNGRLHDSDNHGKRIWSVNNLSIFLSCDFPRLMTRDIIGNNPSLVR